MKVILLQSVKNLGNKNDIVEVSNGYAANALIPKKLAKAATAKEINELKQQQQARELLKNKQQEQRQVILDTLQGKTLTIKQKTNEKGTLYHALGIKEIKDAIAKEYNFSVDTSLFKDAYAFKELGEYQLILQMGDKEAKLHLSIVEQ